MINKYEAAYLSTYPLDAVYFDTLQSVNANSGLHFSSQC